MGDAAEHLSGMTCDEEAEYYEALAKGETGPWEDWDEDRPRRQAAETREEMKSLYDKAKAAPVGSKIICPACRRQLTKRYHQAVFCCNRGRGNCKDRYWNTVIQTRSIKAGGAKLW